MSTENEGSGRQEEPQPDAPEPGRDERSESAAAPGPAPAAPATPPVPPTAPAAPPSTPPAAPPTPPTPPASPAPPTASAPPAAAPQTAAGAVPPPVPPAPPASPGAATGAWAVPPAPPPHPKRRNGLLAGVIVATLIAGGIGGGVGYLVADDGDSSAPASADSGASGNEARPPESVAGIAEAALPSVVTIETGSRNGEGSTGTGFVYDEQGRIMTNNHVVAGGGTVNVTFSDGETFEAEVVGNAEGYDVAVLQLTDIGDRELEPLPMGDSDEVAVGDATIAIGAPFGLSGTVTTGIISAKDRPVSASDATGASSSYMNALQTDASINPGNSGGPLLNADGEVIGINSAIKPGSSGLGEPGGSIGLGFAIPINQAERVAQDLIETGEPVYPIIGAHVDTSQVSGGAQIVDSLPDGSDPVSPGGPADEAGLRPGDVITEFDGRLIDSGPTLISEIWSHEPGETIEVTYERGGQEHTTQVVLGERVGDSES
ncbi:trypsin-like peptidase domain-containing protein [Streptomyces sp. 7-21]|uniref:S1C family serine protease n=1 Tax=Streptomyces sp. 7-21 TaxID=2802283 RepID=UPI0027DBA43B|nr:trypsin-like peptidase domain-containing protein [Streptomyces sp. 7-21]